MKYLGGWVYNIAVLGTTAYYVFERGHSGWWFLLAMCLLWSPDND